MRKLLCTASLSIVMILSSVKLFAQDVSYNTITTTSSDQNNQTSIRIVGPNSPYDLASSRNIAFEFQAAGKAQIQSYRDGGWGTSLDFLTSSIGNTGGAPSVRMHIDPTGSVGIGTATPSLGKLQLQINNAEQPNSQENNFLAIQYKTYASNGIVNSRITWTNANGVRIASMFAAHNAYFTNNADLVFETNNNNASVERMRIGSSGNILIGKSSQTNSAYKLDVAGPIRADQITVNTTGADFVFEKDYHLKSLKSVEKFIATNHHLPEIPSAEKMNNEGMNVGDMNKKLLQKVEELTLYLIEKDREVNNLQLQIDCLNNNNYKSRPNSKNNN